MGCGLSENFTLCNKIYKALFFKMLHINMPRHASKLSEYFTFQFYGPMVQTKSGGDSAVRSEFVITGMMFHPRRIQSELLRKEIEQSFVEVTLLPACH